MLRVRRPSCSSTVPERKNLRRLLNHHAVRQNVADTSHDGAHDKSSDLAFIDQNLLASYRKFRKDVIGTKHDGLEPHALLKQLHKLPHIPRPAMSKVYDLENEFPDRYMTSAARVGSEYFKTMELMRRTEAEALAIGRQIAQRTKDREILCSTFRRLFERCNTVRDVYLVVAIAFLKPQSALVISRLSEPITRALFRSREWASDRRVYTVYHSLIQRMEKANLKIDSQLYFQRVKFAARSRDPLAMQRALWPFRFGGVKLTVTQFRCIVGKFSVGFNGYGEIRNGRWRTRDLLPVLFGFAGTKSGKIPGPTEDYHLGSFLNREDWQILCAWLLVLSRLRAVDQIWAEWQLWRDSDLRRSGQDVLDGNSVSLSRKRDGFFIRSMAVAGGTRYGWRMLSESKIDFWKLDVISRTKLFDDIDGLHITADAFDGQLSLKNALLEKYAHDLREIESKLGVSWEPDEQGGGRHILNEDIEERFEKLSDPNFGYEPGYFQQDNQVGSFDLQLSD